MRRRRGQEAGGRGHCSCRGGGQAGQPGQAGQAGDAAKQLRQLGSLQPRPAAVVRAALAGDLHGHGHPGRDDACGQDRWGCSEYGLLAVLARS